MQLIVTLLVLCLSAMAQDTVRGTTNGWIGSSQILPFENDTITTRAEGRVRALASIAEDSLPLHRDLDGTYVILFRVAAPGAAAMKLHFDEFRLPEGASLLVYGWNQQQGVSRVLGPYEDSGPLKSGDFWTLAVPGSTAVVELQLKEPIERLPFHVDALAAVDGIEESALPFPAGNEARNQETYQAMFRGMAVDYNLVDGIAVWEGDILLGRPEELEPVRKDGERSAGGVSNLFYRWPNGIMPYTVDAAIANTARITDAVNHWNTKLAGHVKLVARTTENSYVTFKLAAPGTCSSYVGAYKYAGQPINIGDYCSTGNVIHEIGHALGLYHEHTRSDRDTYVQILNENVQSTATVNFNLVSSSYNPGAYDYNSIMHYGTHAFSANGSPTIVTKPAGISIGQREGLSSGDVAGIKSMYPAAVVAPTPVPPAVTQTAVRVSVNSNPSGRKVTVDGTQYTAPVNFDWLPGTQHTLSAGANEAAAGTRYVFLGWNDTTSATRTFSTPSTATTLTETYQVQHQLTTSVTNPYGSILVTPASTDGYYAAGANVTLSAKPNDAYCLASWSGLLPVTGLALNLQMTRPTAVGATFAVGSLSVAPWTVNAAAAGGISTAALTTGSACAWSVGSRTPWVTVESAASGNGPTTIRLNVQRNTTGRARSGIIIISQRAMIVRQAAQ